MERIFEEISSLIVTDIARNTIRRLGFRHYRLIEARGLFGRIWLMWHVDYIQVEVLQEDFYFLHVKPTIDIMPSWFLTVVYASPGEGERGATWEQLLYLTSSIQLPWSILDEFNAIGSLEEQKASSPSDINKCCEFSDWIHN